MSCGAGNCYNPARLGLLQMSCQRSWDCYKVRCTGAATVSGAGIFFFFLHSDVNGAGAITSVMSVVLGLSLPMTMLEKLRLSFYFSERMSELI